MLCQLSYASGMRPQETQNPAGEASRAQPSPHQNTTRVLLNSSLTYAHLMVHSTREVQS